jgi:two-component system, sporulation sensor kinase E
MQRRSAGMGEKPVITERKRMMEELGKLSQFRESIIDNANVWLDVLDENANIVIWNKAAEVISGYSREEVVGHGKIWEWLYPDEEYRKSITDLVTDVIQHGRVDEDFETRIRRKDGQTRVISWNERNLLDEHDKVVGSIAIGRDVTERKRAEEALRESEEKYRRLFEQAMDGIGLADAETGILLDCNQALAALVDRNRAELLGQHQAILHPPTSDDSTFSPTFRLHTTTREGQVLETQVITSTREIREVEIKANLLYLQGRKTLQGIFHDITERKRAEEALRRRAEELAALQATVLNITASHDLPILLRTIVERAVRLLGAPAGGIYLCDPEKQEVRCVVSYKTRHDYTGTVLKYGQGAAGIVAQTGKSLIVDDYRSWQGRADVFEEKQPFTAVLTVPMIWQDRVTGVIHVLDDTASRRFTQADQELLTLFANHAAIAVENARLLEQEKHHAEELARYSTSLEQLVLERTTKLSESERKYRSLVENIPDVTWTTDQKGHTVFISPNVTRLCGYSPAEIYDADNTLWLGRIHPDDFPHVKEAFEALFTGNKAFDVEYRIQRKDGNWIWLHDRSLSTYEKDGVRHADGVFSDITERKRMEEQLLRSERLASIGETAAMVGHDLRNPLQSITGTIYVAKSILRSRRPAQKRTMVGLLHTIDEQVMYMDKIVSDLQDYARPLVPEFRETSLPVLVRETLSTIRIPKTLEVSVEVEKDFPNVMIDPDLMRRVLTNLTTNAIQAMPKGGKMVIRAYRTEDAAVLTVKDTGAGIPEENLARLFTPFFSTKAKGQGLGLAVCKRLVEIQSGLITVKSKPGQGSLFTVSIPLGKKEVTYGLAFHRLCLPTHS